MPMAAPFPDPYTPWLRQLMAQQHIPSYRALREQAQVSATAIAHLRRGRVDRLAVGSAQRLSQTLHISLPELLRMFGSAPMPTSSIQPEPPASMPPTAEDQNQAQQQRPTQQAADLTHQIQRQTLALIEPWLRQWPTAAAAATANPELSAMKLLPLVRPLEDLLAAWDVHPMAPVGAEVAYNPRLHQLYQGQAEPGDPVRVRHVGYYHRDHILHRALVSPPS